jgi:hypothetical protein
MPLLLTTPFNPGDIDPGQTYTHAKIEYFGFVAPNNLIEVVLTFGTMAGSVFTKGAVAPNRKYNITGNDFITMVQKLPLGGETTYTAAARELYEWLISKGYAAGTII